MTGLVVLVLWNFFLLLWGFDYVIDGRNLDLLLILRPVENLLDWNVLFDGLFQAADQLAGI